MRKIKNIPYYEIQWLPKKSSSSQDFSRSIRNNFAFQSFVFEGENKPFILENASSLTHEFLYDNLN